MSAYPMTINQHDTQSVTVGWNAEMGQFYALIQTLSPKTGHPLEVDDVIVSPDAGEILDVARQYGEVPDTIHDQMLQDQVIAPIVPNDHDGMIAELDALVFTPEELQQLEAYEAAHEDAMDAQMAFDLSASTQSDIER